MRTTLRSVCSPHRQAPLVATATALILLMAPLTARAQNAADVGKRIEAAQALLEAWQLDDAAIIAEELHRTLPDVPPVQAIVGTVKFHQGDFLGAKRLLERASEGGADPMMVALAKSTYEETKGSVTFESDHFVLRTPPGKDELLAPIALESLEKAYARVTLAFDYAPRHKIAVDILHDARGLANVSTLTVKEIETSGTIALCKFNRLMVTSPKALARGYGWLDTLSHELIHLVISEKARNEVPIWLHEGLAKYSETLWRGDPGLALEPPSENLLAKAVKKKKLITFEQMHPSMAKLPSQKDTALAFAEVFTVVEWMHTQKIGGGKRTATDGDDDKVAAYATTNRLLDELSVGKRMDTALQAAVGKNLRTMQTSWKRYLKKRKFKLVPGAQPKRLTFVRNARGRNASVDEDEDEGALREAQSDQARRFVRLGNLLLRRGRARAATVEYEKARREIGVVSPVLSNRLAQLRMELGQLEEAKQLLQATVKAHPSDPQTRVLLGRLALREARLDDARQHYERATWENPFNPEIHLALRKIGEDAKDDALKTRATDAIRLLTGHAKKSAKGWVEPAKGAPFATLSVSSEPWGELLLDGKPTGITTPVSDLRIPPGPHRVRVRDRLSGRQGSESLDAQESQSLRVNLTLENASAEQVRQWVKEEDALRAPKAPAEAAPGSPEGEKGAATTTTPANPGTSTPRAPASARRSSTVAEAMT